MSNDIPAGSIEVQKVRVFIDFWNFQLSLNRLAPHFPVDWSKFPAWLAQEAGSLAAGDPPCQLQFEGAHIHLSYNPRTEKGRRLRHWSKTVLDRFAGIQVECKERKPKRPPTCQSCYREIEKCPHCGEHMAGTIEKGIDTGIVTDMIKLAWEDTYQIGILVSADRDFIPAVEFLQSKGKKIIQAGFPSAGMELAQISWASFDIGARIEEFRRT